MASKKHGNKKPSPLLGSLYTKTILSGMWSSPIILFAALYVVLQANARNE